MAISAPPRPNRVLPQRAHPDDDDDKGPLIFLGLGAAVAGWWYYAHHHCSPACELCQTCSGGHCVDLCPTGQVCGATPGICVTALPPPTQSPSGACDYTVRGGDTLISIAARAYGSNTFPAGQVIWEWLYTQNPQIKTTAQSHGITSNWWHWIYPGEVIHLPVSPPGSGSTATPNCAI